MTTATCTLLLWVFLHFSKKQLSGSGLVCLKLTHTPTANGDVMKTTDNHCQEVPSSFLPLGLFTV